MKYSKGIIERSLDIILMQITSVKSLNEKQALKQQYSIAYLPYRNIVDHQYQKRYLQFMQEVRQ